MEVKLKDQQIERVLGGVLMKQLSLMFSIFCFVFFFGLFPSPQQERFGGAYAQTSATLETPEGKECGQAIVSALAAIPGERPQLVIEMRGTNVAVMDPQTAVVIAVNRNTGATERIPLVQDPKTGHYGCVVPDSGDRDFVLEATVGGTRVAAALGASAGSRVVLSGDFAKDLSTTSPSKRAALVENMGTVKERTATTPLTVGVDKDGKMAPEGEGKTELQVPRDTVLAVQEGSTGGVTVSPVDLTGLKGTPGEGSWTTYTLPDGRLVHVNSDGSQEIWASPDGPFLGYAPPPHGTPLAPGEDLGIPAEGITVGSSAEDREDTAAFEAILAERQRRAAEGEGASEEGTTPPAGPREEGGAVSTTGETEEEIFGALGEDAPRTPPAGSEGEESGTGVVPSTPGQPPSAPVAAGPVEVDYSKIDAKDVKLTRDEQRDLDMAEKIRRRIEAARDAGGPGEPGIIARLQKQLDKIEETQRYQDAQRKRDQALLRAVAMGQRGIDPQLVQAAQERERARQREDQALLRAAAAGERGVNRRLVRAAEERERARQAAAATAAEGEKSPSAPPSGRKAKRPTQIQFMASRLTKKPPSETDSGSVVAKGGTAGELEVGVGSKESPPTSFVTAAAVLEGHKTGSQIGRVCPVTGAPIPLEWYALTDEEIKKKCLMR